MTSEAPLSPQLMEAFELKPFEYGGWLIKETETHFVVVTPMIFNHRICYTPKNSPETYDFGWCYDKGHVAVAAAYVWDPDIEEEPLGYKKAIGHRVLP